MRGNVNISMNEVVVKSNNSLAARGAFANRLQCCATISSQNGRQGLKRSYWVLQTTFAKLIFDSGIPSKKNKQQIRKKDTMKTIMEIVTAKVFAKQQPNKDQIQGCCQKGKVHDIQ